jgi:transposase
MAMTTIEAARPVIGGVDTHGELHVAAAVDQVGGLLGTESFAASPAGYVALLGWLSGFGDISTVGVEGTGAYGAGLARFLRHSGITVAEVNRPNRQARRRQGKSDPLDAVEAARAALSGRAGEAKAKDGAVEALRVLLVARRSAAQARTKALVQMRHLVYAAPDDLAVSLKALSVKQLVERASALRPLRSRDQVTASTKLALHALAGRVRFLDEQLGDLDQFLAPLASSTAPALLELVGVGPLTAATLLVVAGDNPERLRSEAAWAHLCGVAPLEASSGKVVRHRLDPGGNRQANSALWRIVMVRLKCDPETQAYMERRSKEGRSKREVVRSLKRYVAREVYRLLPHR